MPNGLMAKEPLSPDALCTHKFISESKRKKFQFTQMMYRIGEPLLAELSPVDLANLIFITTYMSYAGHLEKVSNYSMTEDMLAKLLGVTRHEFVKLQSRLSELNIMRTDGGEIKLNESIFSKGIVDRAAVTDNLKLNIYKTKLYSTGIRDLYSAHSRVRGCKISRTTMGHMFRILPFVNRKFNIICKNPLETEFEHIVPMTYGDIAVVLGWDRSKGVRVEEMFSEITFTTRRQSEYAIKKESGGTNKIRKYRLYINPVLFCADNRDGEIRKMIDFRVSDNINIDEGITEPIENI